MLVASCSEGGGGGRAGGGCGKGNGGIFGGSIDEKTRSAQTLARRRWAACQTGAHEHGQTPGVVGGRLAAVEAAAAAAFGGQPWARHAACNRQEKKRWGNEGELGERAAMEAGKVWKCAHEQGQRGCGHGCVRSAVVAVCVIDGCWRRTVGHGPAWGRVQEPGPSCVGVKSPGVDSCVGEGRESYRGNSRPSRRRASRQSRGPSGV